MKLVVATLVGLAGTAAASPLSDAIATKDVTGLRAKLDDASARCALGVVYAKKNDLPRADLYLYGCDDVQDADIAADVSKTKREVTRKLRDSDYASVQILSTPDNLDAEIDSLPGERFKTGRRVYVPAGHHVVHAWLDGKEYTNTVESTAHADGNVQFELVAPPPKPPKDTVVNIDEGGPMDAPEQGAPPDVKHPKMKIDVMNAHASAGGEQLEDPLAYHAQARPWRFGARVGGGVFDQTEGQMRLGPAVAALATMPLGDRIGVDLRADWTRRGSDGVDALGLTIGPAYTFARLTGIDLRAGAGLRADVRLENTTIFAMQSNTVNVHGAGWIELPLQAMPLTVGLRYEHGLTSLVSGVRDEAVIAEIGFELR